MARGGKGGNRGGNRGRGAAQGNQGYPGGVSPAQSGGISHSFRGGPGGGAPGAAGSRRAVARTVQGTGGIAPNNRYTIVADSGGKTPVKQSGSSKKGFGPNPKGKTSKGGSMFDHVAPHVNKPVSGGH